MDGSPQWFKSSYSGFAENCVEVGFTRLPGTVVRDSRDRDGVTLGFGSREWSGLVNLLVPWRGERTQ
ncbi:DUF397 domain-containing protein [Nocardiopsis aegyptia]|uniref:DUF397 domain-containing protein n=1 Tax=Nocardiopsis aegyptia TaxID=220378 RepID=UPI001C535499|nr:DUF397 domain-containing protein [Nocardiopsis aegyptia]